jgi:hypothetical protein
MSLLVSSPFARDLARLIAGWLVVIVVVQAMASALGLVQGPRHVHLRDDTASTVFAHPASAHGHAEAHHTHDGWARHVHVSPAPGPTLQDDAQDLGAVAGLVLSAMVGLGPPCDGFHAANASHVMRASLSWSCTTHAAPLPERPPRA